MTSEGGKGIYTFPIPLPENPLKWLNCYVIKGENDGRNLLIDAGFNRPECREALNEGMAELGLNSENTDVFFTHLHSDHTGNAGYLEKQGFRLIMGGRDHEELHYAPKAVKAADMKKRSYLMGTPSDVIDTALSQNHALLYTSEPFHAVLVKGGNILEYGGRSLECIETPGHTPGHLCLYDREHKLIFLGDHILFDISPNIVYFPSFPGSLQAYFDSLKKIKAYSIETALPAHRTAGDKTVPERVDELLAHHQARLEETLQAVAAIPGSTVYEIAGHMTWRIRARNWDEFPAGQKWFAVSECLAHLEHLERQGHIISKQDEHGVLKFHIKV